jgi:AmmeMemoRadiSam system protein B
MLLVARTFGAEHSKVLEYHTSGKVTGDFNSVIGYGAAACW